MALALLAGAGILGASMWSTSSDALNKNQTTQLAETKKLGMMDTVYKAPESFTGAVNAFAPYPAPQQNLRTLREVQEAYSEDVTNANWEMAAYNLRTKGSNSRVLIASSDNTPLLPMKLKAGGKLGDIKYSESMDANPMTKNRHTIVAGPIGWAGNKRGIESGMNQADDSSKRLTTKKGYTINKEGFTFNDKFNPYTRGSSNITLANQVYTQSNGATLPEKGNIIPVSNSSGKKSLSIQIRG